MSGAAAKPLLAILIFLAGGSLAFGQAGAIGGTIGKTDKSVSGEEAPLKMQSTKKPLARADTRSRSGRDGGDGAKFDGIWTIVLSPGCPSSGIRTVTVSGGQVKGFGVSGTVSSNGTVHIVGEGGGIVGTGRAIGNTGSGSYRQSDGCSGSVRAIKN
jgi:hypothetical protein